MAEWLWKCENEHSKCSNAEDPALPKRVLDLGEGNSGQTIKLHISQLSQRGRYVALSYCWGGPQQLTTTTSTIKSRIEGIALELLPKTITDAALVTKKLGIRYLWVDALCIIQDADYDRQQEISSMGEIYKSATVSIAAANAKRLTDGFLEDRLPWEMCRLPLYLDKHSFGTIYIAAETYRKVEMNEPLFSRGWAFQEFLLSPRVIVFDKLQATWHCHSDIFKGLVPGYAGYGYTTKADFDNYLSKKQHGSTDWYGPQRMWATLLHEYTARDFTLFEDRLPAISGIVKELSLLWKDEYIAGLWKSHIFQQLAWSRGYPYQGDKPFKPFQHLNTDKRIGLPSWSWKSAPFNVSIEGGAVSRVAADLYDYKVKLKSEQAPFGEVTEATLRISAKLMEIPEDIFTLPRRYKPIFDYTSTKLDENSRILLLAINVIGLSKSSVCIIVQKQESNRYQRVGLFKDDNLNWDLVIAEEVILE
ncbi:heterokaryon incompatibility protein-domain-containing protein [Leptodontidium sp. 2 PMI_412]|nr:heterokaryon incompatibility protein-domain-containing protein [Leptodontidium sp. 2 PMI_412]